MFGIKGLLTSVVTGASAAVSVLLVAVAYSDRLDPSHFPLLACLGMTIPFVILANLVFLVAWLFIKWRRVWIPIVGMVLSFGAIFTYYPLHGSSRVPEGCIKILSYNVGNFTAFPDASVTLDTVCRYLQAQKADIVCLQENNAPDFDRLFALFPYNDTVHLVYSEQMTNVISIHSRYPILRHERIAMQSRANGAVAFYLQVDRQTVMVVNNHLESFHLTPDDRHNYTEILKGDRSGATAKTQTRTIVKKVSEAMALRAPQARAVHRYIESHGSYPTVVCGDFNDTPVSYTRRTIAQGLTDCYASTGTGAGTSYNQKGFRFRIDHILCSSDFRPFRCYVDEQTKGSDHYPIVAHLQLDGFFNR